MKKFLKVEYPKNQETQYINLDSVQSITVFKTSDNSTIEAVKVQHTNGAIRMIFPQQSNTEGLIEILESNSE